jgi:hypothetical protein
MLLPFGYFMTDSHENAHKQICLMFYGKVAYMRVGLFDGETQCENITTAYFNSYSESQAMVEAFGYQLKALMYIIVLLIWALGFIYLYHHEFDSEVG